MYLYSYKLIGDPTIWGLFLNTWMVTFAGVSNTLQDRLLGSQSRTRERTRENRIHNERMNYKECHNHII